MHKEVNEWQKLWWNQSLLLANAVAIIHADINDVKPLAKKRQKNKGWCSVIMAFLGKFAYINSPFLYFYYPVTMSYGHWEGCVV